MTKVGIDYIRGIYQTAIKRRQEAKSIESRYSNGYMSGYHNSTIDLCESIAELEGFALAEPPKGE